MKESPSSPIAPGPRATLAVILLALAGVGAIAPAGSELSVWRRAAIVLPLLGLALRAFHGEFGEEGWTKGPPVGAARRWKALFFLGSAIVAGTLSALLTVATFALDSDARYLLVALVLIALSFGLYRLGSRLRGKPLPPGAPGPRNPPDPG